MRRFLLCRERSIAGYATEIKSQKRPRMRDRGNYKLRNVFVSILLILFKVLFINYDEINLLLLPLHLSKIGEWSLIF